MGISSIKRTRTRRYYGIVSGKGLVEIWRNVAVIREESGKVRGIVV